MSPEPSSSPAPGAGRDRPVWIRSTSGSVADVLDVALKVITIAYVLLGAWQVAKALNPPLKVWEDTTVAAARRRLQRAREDPPGPSAGELRAIYDDTR